jgi:hypothetical protein
MQESALLAPIQQEIQRHDFSHFVETPRRLPLGRSKPVFTFKLITLVSNASAPGLLEWLLGLRCRQESRLPGLLPH